MKLSLFILLIITLLSSAGVGQPLSKDAIKIPASFKSSDAKLIAKALLTSPLYKEKDEFESTAAYEKRINDRGAVTFADGSTADALLIFKVTDFTGLLDGSGASYNADEELLTFKLDIKEYRNYSSAIKAPEPTLLLAAADYKDLGTYMGENAYGTKREIHKSQFTNYRLLINNELDFPQMNKLAYGYSPIKISVKLPAAAARQAKDAFAVLYFVKLARPYLGLDFLNKEPKIDSPSEIKNVTYVVYADVSEIWIFNNITGEVYKKFRVGEPLPPRPPEILQ